MIPRRSGQHASRSLRLLATYPLRRHVLGKQVLYVMPDTPQHDVGVLLVGSGDAFPLQLRYELLLRQRALHGVAGAAQQLQVLFVVLPALTPQIRAVTGPLAGGKPGGQHTARTPHQKRRNGQFYAFSVGEKGAAGGIKRPRAALTSGPLAHPDAPPLPFSRPGRRGESATLRPARAPGRAQRPFQRGAHPRCTSSAIDLKTAAQTAARRGCVRNPAPGRSSRGLRGRAPAAG